MLATPRAEEILNSLGTLMLNDTGGVNGSQVENETFEFIVRLMLEAEKLVRKCLYCKVLAATEPIYLEKILSAGGWDVINSWLAAALKSFDEDHHQHFLQELLSLLAMLPMNVNRLKENDTPKMLNLWLKEKKKKQGSSAADFPTAIVDIANQVVKNWKDIVTNAASGDGGGGGKASKSLSNAKEKKRKSADGGSGEGGSSKRTKPSASSSSSAGPATTTKSYGPKTTTISNSYTNVKGSSRLAQERKSKLKAVVKKEAAAKSDIKGAAKLSTGSSSSTTESKEVAAAANEQDKVLPEKDIKDDPDKPKVMTTKVKASKFRLDFTSSTTTTAAATKKKKTATTTTTGTSGTADAPATGKGKENEAKKIIANGKSSMADSPMSFMEALDGSSTNSSGGGISAVTTLKAKLGRRTGVGANKDISELLVGGGRSSRSDDVVSVGGGGLLPAAVAAAALSTTTTHLLSYNNHNNNKISQSDKSQHMLNTTTTTTTSTHHHQELGLETGGGDSGGDIGVSSEPSSSSSSSYLSSTSLGGYAPADTTTASMLVTSSTTATSSSSSITKSDPMGVTSPVKSAGFSFYKDILEEQSTSSEAPNPAQEQPLEESMAVDDADDEEDNDLNETIKLKADTSEEAMEAEEEDGGVDSTTTSTSTQELPAAKRSSLVNSDGTPRSILKLSKSQSKKKVSWTDERKVRDLVEERLFELDENERVNVNRLNHAQHEAMKRSDAQNEKAMMDEQKHRPEVFAPWRLIPIAIDVPHQAAAVEHGCKSVERAIQEERQKTTLECRFYGRLPDTPAEPELEFYGHQREPTKIIPTEDEATLAAQQAQAVAGVEPLHPQQQQQQMGGMMGVDPFGGMVDPQQQQQQMIQPQQQQFPPPGNDYYGGGNPMMNNGGGPQQQQQMNFANNQGGRFPGDGPPPHFGGVPPLPHQESFNGGGPGMANGGGHHFPGGGPNTHNQFNQGGGGPPNSSNSFDNGYGSNGNNNNFGPGGQNVAAYTTSNGGGGPMYNDYNTSPPNPMYNNSGPPPNHQTPAGGYFNQPPQEQGNNNNNFNNNGNNNHQWANDGGPPPGGPFAPFGMQQQQAPQQSGPGPRFFGNRGGGRGGRFNKKAKNDGICRFWANTGKCKFEERCNFSHHLPGVGR